METKTFYYKKINVYPPMISLTVCSGVEGMTPVTMDWRVPVMPPVLKRKPELESPVCCPLLLFLSHSSLAGQKTKSLGIPSWPGLQDTPDLTFLHSSPCSVTQTPVLLCSASTLGSYLTRQPRPPAQVPASLANPPQVSPYWSMKDIDSQ